MNYYNEFDPYAAQWLRNLMSGGLIPSGFVDERSIEDVQPDDLKEFAQCHFFAGIGGWSRALQLAGWPNDRPVWTGSCPCQPFSAAGKRKGSDDERHLWPAWFHLIEQSRPGVVFGEQVASKDGLNWLDLVQLDLEASGYANWATDFCAAGGGAPHIRQRLWFVGERLADANGRERDGKSISEECVHNGQTPRREQSDGVAPTGGASRGLANANSPDENERTSSGQQQFHDLDNGGVENRASDPSHGGWRSVDWLRCRDDKWRPVEPGTFPLANGVPRRMDKLRAYGNAIVPQIAAHVIGAYLDAKEEAA